MISILTMFLFRSFTCKQKLRDDIRAFIDIWQTKGIAPVAKLEDDCNIFWIPNSDGSFNYDKHSMLEQITFAGIQCHPDKGNEFFVFVTEFIGFLWDSKNKWVSLPEDKHLKYINCLNLFIKNNKQKPRSLSFTPSPNLFTSWPSTVATIMILTCSTHPTACLGKLSSGMRSSRTLSTIANFPPKVPYRITTFMWMLQLTGALVSSLMDNGWLPSLGMIGKSLAMIFVGLKQLLWSCSLTFSNQWNCTTFTSSSTPITQVLLVLTLKAAVQITWSTCQFVTLGSCGPLHMETQVNYIESGKNPADPISRRELG